MTINKKLSLIAVFFIVVPLLVILVKDCIVKDKYFFWGYACTPTVLYAANILVITGSILLLRLNYKLKFHNKFWYTLGALFLLLSVVHILVFYSLYNITLF